MINIGEYILEKLKISRDSKMKIEDAPLLDKALDPEYVKKVAPVRDRYTYSEATDYVKMEAYHNKGSNPQRLVNSIKDNSKLTRRFSVAIDLKWDEAINVFGQAIIDRNIWDEGDVVKYISKRYKKDNK